jgi:hypothetical protein
MHRPFSVDNDAERNCRLFQANDTWPSHGKPATLLASFTPNAGAVRVLQGNDVNFITNLSVEQKLPIFSAYRKGSQRYDRR